MKYEVGRKRKIITFLGAGASAPFEYPTTKSFLERLGSFVEGDEEKLLNSIRSLYWTVEDIEHVVEILDSILDVEKVSNKGLFSNFLVHYPISLDFTGIKSQKFSYSPHFDEKLEWKKLLELGARLRNSVELFTFRQYESKVAQFPGIKREYGKFFSMVEHHSKDKDIEVFTTNYDNVVEDYCCQSGLSCNLSVLGREVNPQVKDSERRILLTKLHGSLDWVVDKQTGRIERGVVQGRVDRDSTRWDRNEYVLFGTKPRLEEANVYSQLFSRLAESLLETELCIVVGFSFRDKHISQVFNDAISKNSQLKLLIVSRSPSEAANQLVKNRGMLKNMVKNRKLFKLRCSFGKQRTLDVIDLCLYNA